MTDGEAVVKEIGSGPTVFISYRRDDTAEVAQRLSVRLREDLGSTSVFRDKDDIIVGDRWQDTLSDALRGSDAAVFLVGPGWPGLREDGTRRIDEQDDPVRNEVLQALGIAGAAAPLPFLIDLDDPPDDVPAEIGALFDDHHYAGVSRASFDAPSSSDYQSVLVGIWNALRTQVPRGVLILGERNAMASLDALVKKLREVGHLDARHLSRFASGAYVASVRESKKLAKKYSDVIVNIDDEEPSEELRGRLAAIVALPGLKAVTLVGSGAAAGMALATTLAANAGSAATFTQASSAQLLSGVAQSGSTGWFSSAWGSAGIGTKLAAVAATAVVAAGGTVAAVSGTGSDSGSEPVGVADVGSPGSGCLVTDTGGIDDRSYNETAWRGALRAAAELEGVTVSFRESPTAAHFRPNIDAFINGGCDVIVTVAFLVADDTAAAAKDNPDQDFAIVDFPVGDFPPWCLGDPQPDGTCGGEYVTNVRGSTFQTDESSFLAGYVAAGMSASGTVGTFGGDNIPGVTIFMDGFVWGVEHYNDVKGMSVQALGWDPDTQTGLFTGNFESLENGGAFAEDLVTQGADIVFPVAGLVGLGSAEFCQDTGSCVMVGVDADQAVSAPEFADVWLTSVLKEMDLFVFDTIENEVLTGSPGEDYVGTLANGGTDIAPYHDFEGVIPQSLKDEVAQLSADIINEVVVPGS